MISTDFAANERAVDAQASISMLCTPWNWIKGDHISEVKNRLRELFFPTSKPFIHLFLTGRAAIYYYLKDLNLPEGSEVVVQAFTCEAVILPIISLGLKPRYTDINPHTYSMSLEDLRNKISDRTRVLILQHTFGIPPQNRQEIIDLARQHDLYILEDCAHGCNVDIESTLTNSHKSAVLFSFGRSKPFSSVYGAALCLPPSELNDQLIETMKSIPMPSVWFIFRVLLYKPLTVLIKATYEVFLGKFIHTLVRALHILPAEITDQEKSGRYDTRFSYGYPNALAWLLLIQLRDYTQIQQQRRSIVSVYQTSLKQSHDASILPLLRYPVLVDNRDNVVRTARIHNIFLGLWYNQPVAPKALKLETMHYTVGSCPIAEDICSKILNLPTTVTTTQAQEVLQYIT